MRSKNFIYFLLLFLIIGFTVPGCTALKYMDGSSDKQIDKFIADKPSNKIKALQNEVDSLKSQIRDRDDQISNLDTRLLNLTSQVNKIDIVKEENLILKEETQSLRGENQILKQEKQTLEEENQNLKAKLTEFEQKVAALKTEKTTRPPKIKVLGSSRRLILAKKTAKKLEAMGYKVQKTGSTPKSFATNTVYYTPDFRTEAERIVSTLGNKTISKPLTWKSIFDIIVVAR